MNQCLRGIVFLMVFQRKDYSNLRSGRLSAIAPSSRVSGRTFWLFSCSCGNEKIIDVASVASGAVRSCGCLHLERCRSGANQLKHGDARKGAVTRLHSIWRGVLKRAGDNWRSVDTRYRDRGIVVCEAWRDYPTFREWALSNGYADNLSIDRINNDGPYAPENCRWTDSKQQARNRRSSRNLTANGLTMTMAAWSEVSGLGSSTIKTRINRGWSVERAISTPPMPGVSGRPKKL